MTAGLVHFWKGFLKLTENVVQNKVFKIFLLFLTWGRKSYTNVMQNFSWTGIFLFYLHHILNIKITQKLMMAAPRHYIFRLSVRPIFVKTMSKEHLDGKIFKFGTNFHFGPTMNWVEFSGQKSKFNVAVNLTCSMLVNMIISQTQFLQIYSKHPLGPNDKLIRIWMSNEVVFQ